MKTHLPMNTKRLYVCGGEMPEKLLLGKALFVCRVSVRLYDTLQCLTLHTLECGCAEKMG